MDKHHKIKTIPIRHRTAEHPSTSSLNSNDSNIEGTFIDSQQGAVFVNKNFNEHDEDNDIEDVITIIDPQIEDRPPLWLLFPDLECIDQQCIATAQSTTQITRILVGKKADFNLLKPSKKLNPVKNLPLVAETSRESSSIINENVNKNQN